MDKLFDTKRTYKSTDGDTYINMVIPVVNVNALSSHSIIRVNPDEKGRIDNYVWRNVGEKMDLIDLTMYANHIFNPFSINEGDLLYIPVDDESVYQSSEAPSLPDGTTLDSVTGKRENMTYSEKVEYLARKGLGIK